MNNEKIKPTYDEVYSAYIIASQERYKYKNAIDKIKEWVLYQQQSNENLEPYISTDKLDDILELLEEVE